MPLQLRIGPHGSTVTAFLFSLLPLSSRYNNNTHQHYKCRAHAIPQHHTTPDHTKMATATTKSKSPESESLIGFTETTEPLVATATAEWRRRKAAGKDSRLRPRTPPSRQQSFRDDFGHAAAETYLITRLSFSLLSYLGVGYRWLTRLFALGCYALLLMPGFLQVGYYYYFSSQVRRSIVYGDQPRNRLDLYLPKDSDGQKPVLIFVTGGAWIIGYKAWGSLLGLQLAERDIIVACLDYRNFPQGTISDMVEDVSQGISFVCSHIAEYGGDPNRIYLMGQSAGAHISACALVEQAMKESESKTNSWSVSQIKCYFGVSGGYNLLGLVDHFDNRGLYRSIFLSIMEGEESLGKFSPEYMVHKKTSRKAVSLLPPIILFHGTADYSIPCNASIGAVPFMLNLRRRNLQNTLLVKDFVDALISVGAEAELILFDGKTHTDLFLQDPLRGGKDEIFRHLLSIIHAGDAEALAKDAIAPPYRRFVPEILLKLAREISPF